MFVSVLNNDVYLFLVLKEPQPLRMATTEATTTMTTETSTTSETTSTTTTTNSPKEEMPQNDASVLSDCGEADIYFLLDASSSVYIVHFHDQVLGFVRDLVSNFRISPLHTRVGVVTFSNDVSKVLVFMANYLYVW